ncbi:MAG: hypothetical protein ABSA54_22985 [Terriglobales bacterium]|jgi:aldehyde dehydrogenase (NAD+)
MEGDNTSASRMLGRREGLGALDFFTTWKAVYVDCSGKLQRAQIDNAE